MGDRVTAFPSANCCVVVGWDGVGCVAQVLRLSYSKLYDSLVTAMPHDWGTLLLYTVLHGSFPHFSTSAHSAFVLVVLTAVAVAAVVVVVVVVVVVAVVVVVVLVV